VADAAGSFGNALGSSLAEQMRPTAETPAKSFSDSIKRDPDWLKNWRTENSAMVSDELPSDGGSSGGNFIEPEEVAPAAYKQRNIRFLMNGPAASSVGEESAAMPDAWDRSNWAKEKAVTSTDPDILRPYRVKLDSDGYSEVQTSTVKGGAVEPKFVIGAYSPNFMPGDGSGVWGSEEPSMLKRFQKFEIVEDLLPLAQAAGKPEAAGMLKHYFDNTGTDRQIDLRKIVETTDAGRDLYISQRNAAMKYAMDNAVDGHNITFASTRGEQRVFSGNDDWFYASGNFTGWSKSTVYKNGNDYTMSMDLNFYDPYNWDRNGTQFFFGTVEDKDLALFHKQGLAKDFTIRGKLSVEIQWSGNAFEKHVARVRKQ
jgi:hypothetical protein